MTSPYLNMLLVEDDPCDVFLIKKELKTALKNFDITVINDGEAALQFIERRSKAAGSSMPDVILLDVGLPGQSGWEILTRLKTYSGFKNVPVIMITGSEIDSEILKRFGMSRGNYIQKWSNIGAFGPLLEKVAAQSQARVEETA